MQQFNYVQYEAKEHGKLRWAAKLNVIQSSTVLALALSLSLSLYIYFPASVCICMILVNLRVCVHVCERPSLNYRSNSAFKSNIPSLKA